jgi:hypothetical protein
MRRVILILLFGYLCFNAQEAQAFIYSHGGEKISKVADLPDEEKWYLNGEYADLAVIYEQSSILWIPMWNSDARYCAAPSQGDHYIPLAILLRIKFSESQTTGNSP